MARLLEELRVERSEIVPVLQALNRSGRIEVILGHGPSAHRYRLKDTEFAEGQEKDDEEQGQAVSTSHTPKTAEDKPAAAPARSKRTTRASLSAVAGKLAASDEAPFAITRIVQSDAGTIVVELDRPPESSRLAFSLSDVLELGHCAAQTVIRESQSAK